jgi:hypothetical protein
MSADGSDVGSDREDVAGVITDAMEPFPLFPVQAVKDLTATVFMGLVRADLDSLGCHGSTLAAVTTAIAVEDSSWQLNSSTLHFKTNEKSRLYIKTALNGWNPYLMGKKKKQIPLSLLPNLNLGRLKTLRGIEMFLTMYLLEEDVVATPFFRHKQCAVVNAAFNVAKGSYQPFPSFKKLSIEKQSEYRLAMSTISRFSTPSGSKKEQSGTKNCTQLFSGAIGCIFYEIFWEAILDMGTNGGPRCYNRYPSMLNHGISTLEHLTMEEIRDIAIDFRRTAFFSAQAAGTKNKWDVSKTTTTCNLKDKDAFTTTVDALVQKTRASALRFFCEPPTNTGAVAEVVHPLPSTNPRVMRQRAREAREALDRLAQESDDDESLEDSPLFPPINYSDRFFSLDIGIIIAPVSKSLSLLTNGWEADRIIKAAMLVPRNPEFEVDFDDIQRLQGYMATPPVFPNTDNGDSTFDGESFSDYYHTADIIDGEESSVERSEVNEFDSDEDDDLVSLSREDPEPNEGHLPVDTDGPQEVDGEIEEADRLDMLHEISQTKRIRFPKYGTAGFLGNAHKAMVALTPSEHIDTYNPNFQQIRATPEYISWDVPKAVEGAQMYMNALRFMSGKTTMTALFKELRYFAENVKAAVTPAFTEKDRIKAQTGFDAAKATMKKAEVAVACTMENERMVDMKHVRYELIYATTDIRLPLTVPVNSTDCCPLDAVLVAKQSDIYNYRKRCMDELMPGLQRFFGNPSPPAMKVPSKASIILHAESLSLFLDADSAFMGRMHMELHSKYPRKMRTSPPAEERVVLDEAEKMLTCLRYGVKARNVQIPEVNPDGGPQAMRRYRASAAEVELLRKEVRLPAKYATSMREVRLTLLKGTRLNAETEEEGFCLLEAPDFTALANLDLGQCKKLVNKFAKLLFFLYLEEYYALVVTAASSRNRNQNVSRDFERITSNFPRRVPTTLSEVEAIGREFAFVSLPRNMPPGSQALPEALRNVTTITSTGKFISPMFLVLS